VTQASMLCSTSDLSVILSQLSAILLIIGIGQLVHWYRPTVVYATGKYKFLLHGVCMVEIVVFERGWVTLSANFRGNWASPTNDCWCQKTRFPGLSSGVDAWS